MKRKLLIFSVFISLTTSAQTKIESIESNNHIVLGFLGNSRSTYAGINYGVDGPEFLPSLNIYRKNGLQFSIAPTFFTDSKIVKKTTLPEFTLGLGYGFELGGYEGILSISHTQIFYGNSNFRGNLNNDFTFENKFNITDNLAISINPSYIFGSKGKNGNAFLLESALEYNFHIEKFLNADQLTITPSISYNYGNDIFVQNFAKKDTLTSNNFTDLYTTLSIIPALKFNLQSNRNEFELNFYFPFYKDTSFANTAGIKPQNSIISFAYNYYFGRE
jgi:hypothetical protein